MTASKLIRGALLVCGLLLTAACAAHNDSSASASAGVIDSAAGAATTAATQAPATSTPPTFTEGDQYVRVRLPTGQAAPTGPIEVVEVFSYGCPHCAEFAPYMDKLRVGLPKNVELRYMPAIFNASWVPYAQAYYAARQLGVFKQTHDALFKAMLERYPLNSLEDLATFYARHGVDQKKFLAAATNSETTRQMAADRKTEMDWGINATPTLVIGRRASNAKDAPFVALMRSNNIDSYEQLQQLGSWMVQKAGKR